MCQIAPQHMADTYGAVTNGYHHCRENKERQQEPFGFLFDDFLNSLIMSLLKRPGEAVPSQTEIERNGYRNKTTPYHDISRIAVVCKSIDPLLPEQSIDVEEDHDDDRYASQQIDIGNLHGYRFIRESASSTSTFRLRRSILS